MFSKIKLLFKKNYISFLKYIIITFFLVMIISFVLEYYNYIISGYNNIAKNMKITVVISNLATNSNIKSVSDSLSKRKEINSLELISSEDGKDKFLNSFKNLSSELDALNPFPAIINLTVKPKYIDTLDIKKLETELYDFDYIDEVRINYKFIKSLTILRNQYQEYLYIISSLILFLILILLFLSYRLDLLINRKILDKTPKFNYTLIVSSNNLINFLFGLFISVLIFLLIWWFFREEFVWISLLHFKTIIISSMISLVLFVLTSIVAIIFYKDSNIESNS